jgi:phosphoribosylformylglycinamidine synthase
MKAAVVRFPGSNCDRDCYNVLQNAGIDARFLWHKDSDVKGLDLIVLPGGFSYGDYLRCGAIARFSPVMQSVVDFAECGGLVLGICNGFQILTEAHLLPGVLCRNKNLRFICKHVNLTVEKTDTPYTEAYRQGEVVSIPIAHGEGCYYIDPPGLAELEINSQVVFRYHGENPNGSVNNIAGIINKRGNILGMMPHPERADSAGGRALFASIICRITG